MTSIVSCNANFLQSIALQPPRYVRRLSFSVEF